MDTLLSQFTSEPKNKDTLNLLKEQKLTTDQINSLLEKAAESIVCGPACQRQKKEEELNKRYLDAKTNIESAPYNLEKAKKNYLVFKNGESYYENVLEEDLIKKSQIISMNIAEKFDNKINCIK
jgi:hypothetical protein